MRGCRNPRPSKICLIASIDRWKRIHPSSSRTICVLHSTRLLVLLAFALTIGACGDYQPPAAPAAGANTEEQLRTGGLESIATDLAIITHSGEPQPATIKRFDSLIPIVTDFCSDVSTHLEAGNLLVAGHEVMENQGVMGENLLEFSENVYWMVSTLQVRAPRVLSLKDACKDLTIMYVTARESGMASQETREGLVEIMIALMYPN